MKLLGIVVISLLVGINIALGEKPLFSWRAYQQMTGEDSSLFVVHSQFLMDAMATVNEIFENPVLGPHKVIGCGLFYDTITSQMRLFCEVIYRTELNQTRYSVFEFRCENTFLLERQTDKKPYWRNAAIPSFQNCVDIRTCPLKHGVALFEKTLREQNEIPSLVAVYASPKKDTIRWCFYGGIVWGEAAKEMQLGGDYNIFLDKSMRSIVQILGGK